VLGLTLRVPVVPVLLRTVVLRRVLIVVPVLLLRARVPLVLGVTVLRVPVPVLLVRTRVPVLLFTTLPVLVRVPVLLLRTDVPLVVRTRVPVLPVRVRTLEPFTPTRVPPELPLRVVLE